MRENKPETRIGWFEREWDAFWEFFKRRRKLARLIIICLCGYIVFTSAKTFWGIPSLNESHKTKIGEIADAKDKAVHERDEAFRDRDKSFRERDDAIRERDKYQVIQAAADRTFKDAPPEKRLDLLLHKVEGIERIVAETNRRLPQKRILSEEAISRLRPAFDAVDKSLAVVIYLESGVADGTALARQLAEFLRNVGFTNGQNAFGTQFPPPVGVKTFFKKPFPPERDLNPFGVLMQELGQENTIYRSSDTKQKTNTALIVIGQPQ